MADAFNIYCDESCHLENDGIRVMVLGAVWCSVDVVPEISTRLREIKMKHGVGRHFEAKWTKVSPAGVALYEDLIDYFFDDDDLHFRGVLIPDKGVLDHVTYEQDHDDWYYKMWFTLLEPIIDPTRRYNIYLDIKDTRSEGKRAKLEDVLKNSRYDPSGRIIHRVQQIRSHESEVLQLADLLIGAIGYHNRDLGSSRAKRQLIERIARRSGKSLKNTTWLCEPKLNLLCWQSGGGAL